MIESLTYAPCADDKLPYAAKLDYFKNNPTTQFKPGLNILFGANGSGKSTLLRMLGLTLAAVQGGVSAVTTDWLQEVLGFRRTGCILPCSVVHDGQPIMYHDAREAVGLIGGGAAFDDDFFSQGVAACLSKGSVGQLSMMRGHRLFSVLTKAAAGEPTGFPKRIVWKVKREHLSANVPTLVDELFEARCPRGPQTLLLDEPESGFGMPWQAGLWRNVLSKVDPAQHQVIVATHSPFALDIEGAHYIEMTPGYARECTLALLTDLGLKWPGLLDFSDKPGRPSPASPEPTV